MRRSKLLTCNLSHGIGADGVYAYQTSFGLARGQVLRRSQGTLLPLSVNQGIESVEQCVTQDPN
jgi:hypothetical protein